MKTIDFLVMIYPCYLSMQAIRKPKNNELRHVCVIWILWFSLVFVTSVIDTLFWWIPFISLFDTVKLLLILLSLREDIADNIRSLLIQPVFNRLKKSIPVYYALVLDRAEAILPALAHYRANVNQTFSLYKNIFSAKPIGDVVDASVEEEKPVRRKIRLVASGESKN